MVNLMLAIEAEFDIEIPQSAMTPDNFDTIAAIDALVSVTAESGLMPSKHRCRWTAMPAASWKCWPPRARPAAAMTMSSERRRALTNLADLVDPPGTVEIGGVRDHLLPVSDGAHHAAHLFAAGRAGARAAGHGVLPWRRLGGRQPGNP